MKHKSRCYTLLLLGLIIVVALVASACKPKSDIQWSKAFDNGQYDSGRSVQQTTDGGYIVCGRTESYGAGDDLWLVRTDAEGNELWDRTFGGEYDDEGNSVQQTADGGFIVCGNRRTAAYYNSEDIWLIKTDADGNTLWEKTFGGEDSDQGNSVQQTADGGFIVCGCTESYGAGYLDIWLIKTDADGNTLWEKTFGGEWFERGYSFQQTADGGYIVCGATYSYVAGNELWLVRTDAEGNKLWDRTFGGWGDVGRSVQQTADGGYIVCGWTRPNGADNYDVWLIKTDADGNKLWDRTFGGWGDDEGFSVQQTADGGYIVCGTTFFYLFGWAPIGKQLFLIRTDADGNKLWDKTLGGIIGEDAGGNSVQKTKDGGYIVCGSISANLLLLKLTPEQ